ncbi:MAG: DUF6152 family protein [Alphaproteobacteria bacterium]
MRARPAAVLSISVLAAALTTAPLAQAHHGFQAEFNAAAPVTMTGWVKQVHWVNPHVLIEVTATDREGVARVWTVLTGTPNTMLSRGLCRDALKTGTHVTISGYESRDKPCDRSKTAGCLAGGSYVVFDGGQTVDLGYRPDGAPLVGVPGISQLPACAPARQGPG